MNSTSTRETTVTADPDVPSVVTLREFDAPREAVFRAHTDPDLLVRWFGPRSTTTVLETFDCRSGGSYRYVHTSEGHEMAVRGCFHEVRSPDRVVQTASLEGAGDGVGLETVELADLGGGRTRLTSTLLVGSFADRDAIVASGMEFGVREGYERLDEVLGETS